VDAAKEECLSHVDAEKDEISQTTPGQDDWEGNSWE
jgi:hypothetical protein